MGAKRKPRKPSDPAGDFFAAVRDGRVEDVRRMLGQGTDPNVTDEEGQPALTLAVREAGLPMVQTLVEAGADVNGRGKEPYHQPIGYALSDDAGEVLAFLVQSGADINACDPYGVPVVMNAIRAGRVEAARFLIQVGAKLFDRHGRGLGDYLNERLPNFAPMRQMLHELGIPFEDASPQTLTRRALEASQHSAGEEPSGFEPAARSPDYERTVRALSQWYAAPAEPLEHVTGAARLRGGWSFAAKQEDVEKWLTMRHRMLLARGFFHFRHVRHFGIGGRLDRVAVLPTADKYAVIEALRTNGANSDVDTPDVIAWLRQLEQEAPFILPGVGNDFLELEFEKRPPDVKALATRIYEFCPDVVDQGTESVEALETLLRNDRRLVLWWD